MSLYKLVSDVFVTPKTIALNVPAVNDVFAFAIKETAKQFLAKAKMWRSKTHNGRSPTGFCVARAAEGGEAFTDLLCDAPFCF
jgi:hypothetical protein